MSRVASCTCGAEQPSSPDLALFVDRSAGTQDNVCRHCRYYDVAHENGAAKIRTPDNRIVACPGFEPLLDGYATDTYYCGHRGWD